MQLFKINILITFIIFLILSCKFKYCKGEFKSYELVSRAISGLVNELSQNFSLKFKLAVFHEDIILKTLSTHIINHLKVPITIIDPYDDFEKDDNCYYFEGSNSMILLSKNPINFENQDFDSTYLTFKKYFFIEFNYNVKRDENFTVSNSSRSYHDLSIVQSSKDKSLLLFRNVLFQPHSCIPTWKVVSRFNGKSMKWKSPECMLEKYKTFFNCSLKYNIINSSPAFSHYNWEMLKMFALRHQITLERNRGGKMYEIYAAHDPLLPIGDRTKNLHPTVPIFHDHMVFFVTRGAPYSSYERLILAFDLTTWLLIIIAFVIAFFVIFLVEFLSLQFSFKRAKFLIFEEANSPSLNVLEIFFGYGLIKIPNQNFTRILIILFTIYCLIIRTAYQGKMFEFLYSNIRHQTVETIAELFEKRIPILIPQVDTDDLMQEFAETYNLK